MERFWSIPDGASRRTCKWRNRQGVHSAIWPIEVGSPDDDHSPPVKTRARSRLARCPHCGLEMVVFGAQTEKTTLRWHRRRGACGVDGAAYYAGLASPEKAPAR